MTSPNKATVFIVDDDDRMRAATERLLKTVGLHSEAFATPQEFLRYKLPDAASCLILDVRLPGMSGLDVQQRSRLASRFPSSSSPAMETSR
jgi:FixJ family two-component response regulator